MIKIENLVKEYNGRRVLDEVNLELPNTGFIVLKGKNGSGKSTLMNMLSTLDVPNSGSITVDDFEITGKSDDVLSEFREKNIGLIFQDNNLFDEMSVRDNINIVGENANFDKTVDILSLRELLDKKAKLLSGGEQQRVAIARAILKGARIVFADEPTSAIDSDSRGDILGLLKQVSQDRLVIMITHDIGNIQNYADMVITLENGKVIDIQKKILKEKSNTGAYYKNKFDILKFTFINLFTNKKQIIRNVILFMLSFLFIIVSAIVFTTNYNYLEADTMSLENEDMMVFDVYEELESGGYGPKYERFTEDDIDYLKTKFPDKKLILAKNININGQNLKFDFDDNCVKSPYFSLYSGEMTFFDIKNLNNVSFGKKPSRSNEIVINSYLADYIIEFGIKSTQGEYYKPKNYEEIINDKTEVMLGNQSVMISGIDDLKTDEYKYLKNEESCKEDCWKLENKMRYLKDVVYVNKDFFLLYNQENTVINNIYEFYLDKNYTNKSINYYNQIKVSDDEMLATANGKFHSLTRGEIIINNEVAGALNIQDDYLDKEITFYTHRHGNGKRSELKFIVKGLSNDDNIYVSKDDVSNYLIERFITSNVIIHETDKKNASKILEDFPKIHGENKYKVSTRFSDRFDSGDDEKLILTLVLLTATFIFSVIAVIYLISYILNSVSYHKREVAILKSLGIDNKNIWMSFLIETVVVVLISFIVSSLPFVGIRAFVNAKITSVIGFKVNLIRVDVIVFILVLFAFLLVTVIVSLWAFRKIKRVNSQVLLKETMI